MISENIWTLILKLLFNFMALKMNQLFLLMLPP
jgi:hypothetical protein